VVRGLASCDYDNDGDLDVALAVNGGRARLWENGGGGGGAVELRLIGASGELSPVGARVEAEVGGRKLVREQRGGGSYQSAPDQRIHVGLGAEGSARIEVRWPSGKREGLGEVRRGELVEVREGKGIVRREALLKRER
ncbi:MAG TPA: ASPIC/UnbV domain-containing protein, partial [Acidobacteriota bacterium]